ncbi:DJ-1/PfpI family protein [Cellulomonas sp. McL0617]|uniref:DJ-1/PfpI family protein n=1 Tax=Cellulomonas sp. McL0617 TaxID=3415675 RepID=UPI003CEBB63B
MSTKVAVLALDGVLAMEVGMPFQILGRLPALGYELVLCGAEPGPVMTSGGYPVVASHGLEGLADADTIVVPAFDIPAREIPAAVLDALRSAHTRGARLVSICGGAFALAAAGVLDGRRATTHWRLASTMAALYPRVDVDPDVLYVDAGSVITSAGVAAGIDVCLHLLRVDHGAAVANEVARLMVAAPHREGGQAQFIERPVAPVTDTSLAATRAWALRMLTEPLTVATLAQHAHLSERTFARQFVVETGTTPLRWLVAARVDRARELLETRDWGSDRVAAECGLGTASNLRVHFRRAVGVTPSDYRRSFAAS